MLPNPTLISPDNFAELLDKAYAVVVDDELMYVQFDYEDEDGTFYPVVFVDVADYSQVRYKIKAEWLEDIVRYHHETGLFRLNVPSDQMAPFRILTDVTV